jgi:hypothetical protein
MMPKTQPPYIDELKINDSRRIHDWETGEASQRFTVKVEASFPPDTPFPARLLWIAEQLTRLAQVQS